MEYATLVELAWDSLRYKFRTRLMHEDFVCAIAHYIATVDPKHWHQLSNTETSEFSPVWLVKFMDKKHPLLKDSEVRPRNFKKILVGFMSGSAKRLDGKRAQEVVAGIIYKFAQLRHLSDMYPEFPQLNQEIILMGFTFVQQNGASWEPVLKIPFEMTKMPAYYRACVAEDIKYVELHPNTLPARLAPKRKKSSQGPVKNLPGLLSQTQLPPEYNSISTGQGRNYSNYSQYSGDATSTSAASNNNPQLPQHNLNKKIKRELFPFPEPETTANNNPKMWEPRQGMPSNKNNSSGQLKNGLRQNVMLSVAPAEISQLETILRRLGASVWDFHTRVTASGRFNGRREEMLNKMKELFLKHIVPHHNIRLAGGNQTSLPLVPWNGVGRVGLPQAGQSGQAQQSTNSSFHDSIGHLSAGLRPTFPDRSYPSEVVAVAELEHQSSNSNPTPAEAVEMEMPNEIFDGVVVNANEREPDVSFLDALVHGGDATNSSPSLNLDISLYETADENNITNMWT